METNLKYCHTMCASADARLNMRSLTRDVLPEAPIWTDHARLAGTSVDELCGRSVISYCLLNVWA